MTVSPPLARFVIIAASIVAVLELVVLRVVTRTAVFIPGISERIGVVSAVGELGRFAYSISLTLVGTTLLLLTLLAARHPGPAPRAVATGIVAFAVVALTARMGWVPRVAADVVTLGSIVMVASAVHPRPRAAAIAVVAYSVAFALAGMDAIARNLGGQAAIPENHGLLLEMAEWVVVGAALAALVAHRRGSGASLALGAVLGGALLLGLVVASATVRILLLWNVGLPGSLPAVAYGVAALALALTIMTAARRRQLATAAGLTLLAAGGIGLHNTYQSGLVLAGLAVLALRHLLDPAPGEWAGAQRHRAIPDARMRGLPDPAPQTMMEEAR